MRAFGYEAEWSNIDKEVVIPKELGCWEGDGSHSEVDLINEIDGVFKGAWPNQRWGGELNTSPKTSVDKATQVIEDLYQLLSNSGPSPVRVTPISNGHVHVSDDAFGHLDNLKKLYDFTLRNQDAIISYWLSLPELPTYKTQVAFHKSAYRYLRNDGGKRLSANFVNAVAAASNVDEFQRALVPHAKESGKILWARAGRPGINLHSLRHTGTVEFRCMKASANPNIIKGQFTFADDFVDRVLNDGPDYTADDLKCFIKPETDPDGLFDQERFLDGLNDWWDTREERKKAGLKKRVGNLKPS